jgi:hypothetical protein
MFAYHARLEQKGPPCGARKFMLYVGPFRDIMAFLPAVCVNDSRPRPSDYSHRKECIVKIKCLVFSVAIALVLCLFDCSLYAQDEKAGKKIGSGNQLVGVWELYQTKGPHKPYERGYKDRPFVNKGPQAFALIIEFREDGTFRRLSRVGPSETVKDGTWKFSCSELRQQMQGSKQEEIMYVRFDNPNQFTSIEVYEDSADPGLFAQFRRVQ